MPRRRRQEPEIQGPIHFRLLVFEAANVDMESRSPEERGNVIHCVDEIVQYAKMEIDKNWLKLGACWQFATVNKIWTYMNGSGVQRKADLIKHWDLGVKESTLRQYASIFKMFNRFLTDRQRISVRKLMAAREVIIDQEFETDEEKETALALWVDRAENLGWEPFMNEVREARGQVATDVCEHPADQSELWSRCGKCKKWLNLIPNMERQMRQTSS